MSYNWKFTYVGGVPRVHIAKGEDIAHLRELDEKMWTVLSCPVKGLEIDEQSLRHIDINKSDYIHVSEVVATAEWLCSVLKNPDLLIPGTDSVKLSDFDTDKENGAALLAAAQQILAGLDKNEADSISLADSSSCLAGVMAKKMEALKAERAAQAAVAAPYGEQTDAIAAAYAALDAKVKDYFLRSRLAAFAQESTAALDVQVAQIEAISAANLTEKTADIAAYPIARVTGQNTLPLDAPVNPAWADQWNAVKPAFAADITESDWNAVGAGLAAYATYKASLEVTEADVVVDEETASIQLVDKLLHLTRDFYTLLCNFVTLSDFYNPTKKAIFQAGTLYIDQRACDLCLRVTNDGAMAAQAAGSNLFLVFCTCTDAKGAKMNIVAAMTKGSTTDIFVGKNAIFYDRRGGEWDAIVTSIIDNPISIPQAAWSPYRKLASFIEEKIRSMAQSREDSVINKAGESVNEKADSAASSMAEAPAGAGAATSAKDAGKAAASGAFDIAKFAGIFAAIGMAIGFIGSFITSMVTGFLALTWWQMPLCILAILLLISGPSMFLAWMKLRKRNLAPVLNANGWAVNAAAMISIAFGNAMTDEAKFPYSAKLRAQDPFADKATPLWKQVLSVLIVLAVVLVALWFCNVFAGIECLSWLPASPL